jgi:ATP synthase (C/AC39) subunit
MPAMGMTSTSVRSKTILTANSYIEGLVRGYRNTLLTSQNYNNLTQCESIDGLLTLMSFELCLTGDRR